MSSQPTPLAAEPRLVVRCPHCQLNQYAHEAGTCRRCHKSVRPAAAPPPTVVEVEKFWTDGETAHATDPSAAVVDLAKLLPLQIVTRRKALRLSQRQIAKRMGVPRTYISKIENGKALPILRSLEKLAAALRCGIGELITPAATPVPTQDYLLQEIASRLPRLNIEQRDKLLELVQSMADYRERAA